MLHIQTIWKKDPQAWLSPPVFKKISSLINIFLDRLVDNKKMPSKYPTEACPLQNISDKLSYLNENRRDQPCLRHQQIPFSSLSCQHIHIPKKPYNLKHCCFCLIGMCITFLEMYSRNP